MSSVSNCPPVYNKSHITYICENCNKGVSVNEANYLKECAIIRLPNNKEYPVRILKPTIGPDIILDVREFHSSYGIMLYDPGYTSTASCCSAITYVNGEEGICMYRGYKVVDLINSGYDYQEVCYLLLYGELPQASMLIAFQKQIEEQILIHEKLRHIYDGFITGAHPMSILGSVTAAMASLHDNPLDNSDWEERELAIIRILAKMPTMVAWAYKNSIGEPLIYPRGDLSYTDNFLHMMFTTTKPYVSDPMKTKILDTFFIIHADHEQNASTSTVRTVGSSRTNPYTCISAGIAALWGRAHGGANEAVIHMLREIGCKENINKFVADVKSRKKRLMGFGHRIYKNYDPRAKVMRSLCLEWFERVGKKDILLELALELEEVALNDDYFLERRLYPNVDYYSGILLRAIGIPEYMFTCIFALGRCVGWLAHWKELVQDSHTRICRPRQLYLGNVERNVSENDRSLLRRRSRARSLEEPFHIFQAREAKKTQLIQPTDYEFDVWGDI
ncbi:citrate synthase I family protein [Cryptosporidium muris RN66]|uniref:Citrate synthase n=1 Tax=Cryptosporidium muris (strain RN66) TaxID=441375 RepID=B6ABP9_CRYMR|nr:citrate synthase I family protein [Cryptosporidium muris RN66]EEA05801.1 citrate synthase I family protein [Cryptosporidium muris RN66]|eukprot:XP_002140150.1 citrate synthase I family protein [Cryptosporidium muris RN66]